jgi:hypothetical protein
MSPLASSAFSTEGHIFILRLSEIIHMQVPHLGDIETKVIEY